jgi:hypothetical protein
MTRNNGAIHNIPHKNPSSHICIPVLAYGIPFCRNK